MLPRSLVVSCFDPSFILFHHRPPPPSAPVWLILCFVCFIGQRENIWGPFLIISPASTLNNWHQEFSRFVPKFKVKMAAVQGNTCSRPILSVTISNLLYPHWTKSIFRTMEIIIIFFLAFKYFCWKKTAWQITKILVWLLKSFWGQCCIIFISRSTNISILKYSFSASQTESHKSSECKIPARITWGTKKAEQLSFLFVGPVWPVV